LEEKLAKRKYGSGNESEGISSDQLDLFLLAIQQEAQQALQKANDALEQASNAPPNRSPSRSRRANHLCVDRHPPTCVGSTIRFLCEAVNSGQCFPLRRREP
jgi:hypothetical protein